jgi:hypothetical protein
MFRELGNGRTNHSNGIGGTPMTRAYGGFGERNAHKSTKAIIGIAILHRIVRIALEPGHAAIVGFACDHTAPFDFTNHLVLTEPRVSFWASHSNPIRSGAT